MMVVKPNQAGLSRQNEAGGAERESQEQSGNLKDDTALLTICLSKTLSCDNCQDEDKHPAT